MINCSGIYQIVNITTGKFYIGSAVNIRRRFNGHKLKLRRGSHDNPKLQNAWNFYGENNFKFLVLEVCNKSNLIIKEQAWMDWLNPFDNGYNILKVAGSSVGYKHTEEFKSLRSRLYQGRKHSEEQKLKISLALKGKKKSREHVRNIKLGKSSISVDTRNKIGKAHKGKTISIEHRKIVSEAQKGNKHTLGYRHTEESKLKMSMIKKNKNKLDSKELRLYGKQIIIGE